MAKIRCKGNKSTERRLAGMLRQKGISGWRLCADDVFGKPDIYFDARKKAIFVDGCFWHGCAQCFKAPAENGPFWRDKISRNKIRDALVTRTLKKAGIKVVRLWEHELSPASPKLVRLLGDLLAGR